MNSDIWFHYILYLNSWSWIHVWIHDHEFLCDISWMSHEFIYEHMKNIANSYLKSCVPRFQMFGNSKTLNSKHYTLNLKPWKCPKLEKSSENLIFVWKIFWLYLSCQDLFSVIHYDLRHSCKSSHSQNLLLKMCGKNIKLKNSFKFLLENDLIVICDCKYCAFYHSAICADSRVVKGIIFMSSMA